MNSDLGIYISITGKNRREAFEKILPVLQKPFELIKGEKDTASLQSGEVGDEIRIIVTGIDSVIGYDECGRISPRLFLDMKKACPDATWRASVENVIDFGKLQDLSLAKAKYADGALVFRRRIRPENEEKLFAKATWEESIFVGKDY